MVLTASTMLELGAPAPPFTLPDTKGTLVRLDDFHSSAGLLVVFLCNHCPYVKHLEAALATIGSEYMPRGIAMVGINSNDTAAYPEDSPARMAEVAQRVGYPFPYLYDASQEVAQAYRAACTPDFFLFDRQRHLVYRGQFDDARPGKPVPVTGRDLRRALEALLSGQPIDPEQRPSMGCNIKWRPGNEPGYFGG